METLIITNDLIEAGKSDAGGWTRQQIESLGISWPPREGWKTRLIGTVIEKSRLEKFMSLKNTSKKMRSREANGEKVSGDFPGMAKLDIGEMITVTTGGKSFVIRRTK